MKKKASPAGYLIALSLLILGFVFFTVLFSSLLFIFNIPIGFLSSPVGLILSLLLFLFFYNKTYLVSELILVASLALVLFFLMIYIQGNIIPDAYDSWSYHIPAIISLSKGWNPLLEHVHEHLNIWSLHYPKSIWIFSAAVYSYFNNLVAGKAITFLIMLSTFFIAMDLYRKNKKMPFPLGLLFSLLIAINPVIIAQSSSYYNDGILGNCVVSIVLILYGLDKRYYNFYKDTPVLALLIMLSTFLANIKYTGLFFLAILFLFYFIILLSRKIIALDRRCFTFTLLLFSSFLLVGASTYLTNIFYHQNPGYPIIGKDKLDIITLNKPDVFLDINKYAAFFMSNTGGIKNSVTGEYHYQFCPDLSKNEIGLLQAVDLRWGGFGPLFQYIGYAFVLVCLLFLINLILRFHRLELFKKTLHHSKSELTLFLLYLILIVTTPEIWWARYVPFLYPLCLFLLSLQRNIFLRSPISNLLLSIILILSICNAAFFIYAKCMDVMATNELYSRTIHELRLKNDFQPICFYYTDAFMYKRVTALEFLSLEKIVFQEINQEHVYSMEPPNNLFGFTEVNNGW